MSDVSVIGSGSMGGALTTALAEAGHHVTIWNRTGAKSEALAGPHVLVAQDLIEAIEASPVSIFCVAGHDVARTLLEEAGERLDGKAIVGVSFATPEEADRSHGAVRTGGGRALDLAIMAYPGEIGSDAAHLLVSGDHEAYLRHRERLEALGTLTYVGELPGAAFVQEMAVLLPYLPMAVSLLQSARICELHGLSLDRFAETVQRVQPPALTALLERVTNPGDPADPEQVEASVEVWAEGAAEYREYLAELGLDTGMYDALQRMFAAGVEAGRGGDDWTSVATLTTTGESPADRAVE